MMLFYDCYMGSNAGSEIERFDTLEQIQQNIIQATNECVQLLHCLESLCNNCGINIAKLNDENKDHNDVGIEV